MTQTVLYLLVFALLYAIYKYGLRTLRCFYCGEVSGHTEHCPRNGL